MRATSLIACANRRDEARWLARQLKQNRHRSDQTAVFFTQTELYAPLLEAQLGFHRIPYHVTYETPLAGAALWRDWLRLHTLLTRKRSGGALLAGQREQQLLKTFEAVDADEWLQLLDKIESNATATDPEIGKALRQVMNEAAGDLGKLFALVRERTLTRTSGDASGIALLSLSELDDADLETDGKYTDYKQLFVLGCSAKDMQLLGQRLIEPLMTSLLAHPGAIFTYAKRDLDGQPHISMPLLAELSAEVIDPASLTNSDAPAVAPTPVDSVLSDYIPPTTLSATALSQFAICPYRYFGAYLLELRENEEDNYWGLSPRRIGEFAHKVFELELTRAANGELPDDARFEAIAAEFFPNGFNGAFQRLEWEQAKRCVREALQKEIEFIRDRRLRPLHFELQAQLDCGGATPLRVRCRIDRVDELVDEGTLWVTDYKTRSGSIGPAYRQQIVDLVHPQLPIYLLALRQQYNKPLAGGAEVRVRSGKRGGIVGESLAKRFKERGFEKLDDATMVGDFETRLTAMLQRLTAGKMAPQPRDPKRCGLGNCPYYGLCRFDLVADETETEGHDATDA